MTPNHIPLHPPVTTPIDHTHTMCLAAVARIRDHVLHLRSCIATWEPGDPDPYHHTARKKNHPTPTTR